jgi:hypothetical protein
VVGERYQVFGERDEDGTPHTSICTGTRHLEEGQGGYVPVTSRPPLPPTQSPRADESPSPTPTYSPLPTSPAETEEPLGKSGSVLWPSLAAGLALGALGLAGALALRRRS